MNQMMLYSKIVTIRDAQIQEKCLDMHAIMTSNDLMTRLFSPYFCSDGR